MQSERLRKIGIIVLIAFVSVIFTAGMYLLLTTLGIHVPKPLDGFKKIPEGWLAYLVFFVFIVMITPIIEEFLFRWIPLYFAKRFAKNRWVFWGIAISVSVIGFGYVHGGWPNIFIQGIFGLVLVIVFLRFGYWYAVLTHAIYNAFCITPLLLFILISGHPVGPAA